MVRAGSNDIAGQNNLYIEVKHVGAAARAAVKNLKGEGDPGGYT